MNIPAAIGFLLTVAWMAFYFTLMFYPQHFGREADFSSFVKQDWNELGDALAGVFAPLAFLWLVVAVFVQSRELNAQHRQLAMQTEEWKQTRKVLEAQKVESEKTARYIGQQTAFMKFEYQRNKLEVSEENFSALLIQFYRLASSTLMHKVIAVEDENGTPSWMPSHIQKGGDKIFNELGTSEPNWKTLDKLWGALYALTLKSEKPIRFSKVSFAMLHNDVEPIAEYFKNISPKSQQILIQNKFSSLVSIIRKILRDHSIVVELEDLQSKNPIIIDKAKLGFSEFPKKR